MIGSGHFIMWKYKSHLAADSFWQAKRQVVRGSEKMDEEEETNDHVIEHCDRRL